MPILHPVENNALLKNAIMSLTVPSHKQFFIEGGHHTKVGVSPNILKLPSKLRQGIRQS